MQTVGARILVVDDDAQLRRAIVRQLRDEGYVTIEASDGVEAMRQLVDETSIDLVLTDLSMPRADGMAVIRAARGRIPAVPVVVLTASRSMEACVAALRAGAQDFLTKPCHESELVRVLERVLTPDGGMARREPAATILGESVRLRATLMRLSKEADGDHPVLLRAEPGVGAEVLARLLVSASSRAGRPFIVLRPAVTDDQDLDAVVESAASGVLFVDEVAALSVRGQQILLAETRRVPVCVRVIAVTRESLTDRAKAGTFDAELAALLEKLLVEVPSLRERREDIPVLAQHVLDEANSRLQRHVTLRPEVLEAMQGYPWPGNVAELTRMVERLAAGSDASELAGHRSSAESGPWVGTLEDPVDVGVWLEDGSHRDVTLERASLPVLFTGEPSWARVIARGQVAWISADKIVAIRVQSQEPIQVDATSAPGRVMVRLRGGLSICGWPLGAGVEALLSEEMVLRVTDDAFEYHLARLHVLSIEMPEPPALALPAAH